jgi:hypothetical protein
MGYLSVDGRIILKSSVKLKNMRMWTVHLAPVVWNDVTMVMNVWLSHKAGNFLPDKQVLASQGGLCSMELVPTKNRYCHRTHLRNKEVHV